MKIREILARLFRAAPAAEDERPANPDVAASHRRKLAAARRRHRKPFITEVHVQRTTSPSDALEKLNRKSAGQAPGELRIVMPIGARRKS